MSCANHYKDVVCTTRRLHYVAGYITGSARPISFKVSDLRCAYQACASGIICNDLVGLISDRILIREKQWSAGASARGCAVDRIW